MIPFFFANNNVIYAWWFPVHLRCMLFLVHKHPGVFQKLQFDKFVVFQLSCTFSGRAIAQAHADIKGESGAISVIYQLLEDER